MHIRASQIALKAVLVLSLPAIFLIFKLAKQINFAWLFSFCAFAFHSLCNLLLCLFLLIIITDLIKDFERRGRR